MGPATTPASVDQTPKADVSGESSAVEQYENRGAELTFAETGEEKTFLFAKNNTFIQVDGDIIQTFQLRFVL